MQIEVNSGRFTGESSGLAGSAAAAVICMTYFLLSICVIGFLLGVLFILPLCWISRFYPPAWRMSGRVQVRGITFLMWVQPWLRAEVQMSLPDRGGYLTVSNHRSHLDMFFILANIPNVRAVTKHSLFSIPFLSLFLRAMKMIPVVRGNADSYLQAMQTVKSASAAFDPVHIFPEMTRCSPYAKGTSEFQLMPFRVAQESKIMIVPLVFVGTDGVWPKGFFGLRPGRAVLVKSLPPIDPSHFANAAALRDETRLRIDEELSRYGS